MNTSAVDRAVIIIPFPHGTPLSSTVSNCDLLIDRSHTPGKTLVVFLLAQRSNAQRV